MDHVASILGIDLPVFNARRVAMKPHRSVTPAATIPSMLHCDNTVGMIRKRQKDDDDDDTASTASASDSDSDSFVSAPSVSFAEPLVTAVMTRPYTSLRDKYALYYSNYDFAEFRREANGYERREKVVKFSVSVVSEVWTVPSVKDASSMYYSKEELQG